MQPAAPQSQPAVDRPVFVADVMPFAKKSCTRCHGSGAITRVMHAGAKGRESRETDGCSCAVNRFKKKCGNDVVLLNGVVHWKAGKAPALAAPAAPRNDAQPPVQDPA